jgi:hypothetical protein
MQKLMQQTAAIADDFRRQLAQVQLFYQFLAHETKAPRKEEPYLMHKSA